MVYLKDLGGPSLRSQHSKLLLSHILKLHQIPEQNLKKLLPELKAPGSIVKVTTMLCVSLPFLWAACDLL